ncbi:MAG: 2-octaprenyl-3-methyl-6-methoxy-1,4-benzoquinol hydroxylase [Rubrivivax sp.]|nr:MAG: 2-octaprenyl-3-methyl-6-methoxy-1,4-benzoquinol hydroxylase [Rubrivivax sp.]
MTTKKFDVCVSGSGAVARCLALALSSQGWRVAWAGAEQGGPVRPEDIRTYALNARSVALLDRLRIWPALQSAATPVHDMQIRGDGRGHLAFSAWQQCVSELAWIVDAAALERLLGEALKFAPHVTVVPPLAAGAPPVEADLLAVCEGKHSATRAALGVDFTQADYGHWGVAARLRSSQPHQGVARQWFRAPDVLALLPFHHPEPGATYGLVWSLPKARAQELMSLPPAGFEAALRQALDSVDAGAAGVVGELSLASEVAAWPLALAQAERWSGPGWVLLGDAAHQVHPLAGQGLNLGLADAETLVSILTEARDLEPWRTAGDERLLRRYARRRDLPTRAMAGVTDGLLRLFADDRAPLRELRNTGMALLDQMSPVKRWLVGRALDA